MLKFLGESYAPSSLQSSAQEDLSLALALPGTQNPVEPGQKRRSVVQGHGEQKEGHTGSHGTPRVGAVVHSGRKETGWDLSFPLWFQSIYMGPP